MPLKTNRGGTSGGATGGLSEDKIKSTRSLVSAREGDQALVDETLGVFRQVGEEYGAQVSDIVLAKIVGSRAIAYYDADGNIGINEKYFNKATMDAAYAKCVEAGFHPSNGNKTALEAVVAHELGHKLTADIAERMGMQSFDGLHAAADRVVGEARKRTSHSSKSSFASSISGYATYNSTETIAEAFSDVFCNGRNARAESRAVVDVIDSYLKGAR